jgi:hypothetical protein
MQKITRELSELRPYVGSILKGMRDYASGKTTPSEAHIALIALHGRTQGRSTNLISSLLSFHRPFKYKLRRSEIFGEFDDGLISPIVQTVKKDGYAILPVKLPQPLVDKLSHFARTTPSTMRGGPGKGQAVFGEGSSEARIYQFMPDQLYANEDVQNIMADALFMSIAGRYLGVQPVIDVLTMWWSAVGLDGDFGEAAQLYHFDMDRPRWLKLFIYLTDVDEDSGPHVYVRGSHRLRSEKIARLLSRGYVRIPDEDIIDAYGEDSIRHVCAPAGTIFVADTIGFHKGLPPSRKPRLILEFSYATTLFGATTMTARRPPVFTKAFIQARKTWPRAFSLFEL